MISLYIDTESSDYVINGTSLTDPGQPLICQVAAVLSYTQGRVISTLSAIISQTKWVGIRKNLITERCTAKHGVTDEMCERFGEAPDTILHMLSRWVGYADRVVAHNIQFDIGMIERACNQQQLPPPVWPEEYCTMINAAKVMKIPSGGSHTIDGYKAPKLTEAYQFFTKKPLVNNHDALADVYACRYVHRGILKTLNPPEEPK